MELSPLSPFAPAPAADPGTSAPGTGFQTAPLPAMAAEAALLAARPGTDQVHIQPLDAAGAWQILLAEVRAALAVPGAADLPGHASSVPPTLVHMFLRALPEAQTRIPAPPAPGSGTE